MKDIFEIEAAFRPAGRLDQVATMRVMKLQKAFEDFAKEADDFVYTSAYKTLGMRALEEAQLWLTKGITHFKTTVTPENYPDSKAPKKDVKSAEEKA